MKSNSICRLCQCFYFILKEEKLNLTTSIIMMNFFQFLPAYGFVKLVRFGIPFTSYPCHQTVVICCYLCNFSHQLESNFVAAIFFIHQNLFNHDSLTIIKIEKLVVADLSHNLTSGVVLGMISFEEFTRIVPGSNTLFNYFFGDPPITRWISRGMENIMFHQILVYRRRIIGSGPNQNHVDFRHFESDSN